MASLYRPGLARRLAVLTEAVRRKVAEREDLREHAKATASIRAALAGAKLDPAQISCLRNFADAEPRLKRLGDTPELELADAVFAAGHRRPASRESLAAEAAERAPGFAGQPPPDRGASLLDWYAWSLAAGGKTLSRTRGEGGRGQEPAAG
jgi:hypothetical protein